MNNVGWIWPKWMSGVIQGIAGGPASPDTDLSLQQKMPREVM